MSRDLEFFSDEFMSELIRENNKKREENDEDLPKKSAKVLPEEFRRTEEEIAELKSLIPGIAKELQISRLNYEEIKRYGKFLAATKAMPKAKYCEELAKAFCTPESFFEYYDKFSEGGKEIFYKLAFSPIVSKKEIIEKTLKKAYNDFYFYRDSEKIPMSFIISFSYSVFSSLPKNTKKALQIHLKKFKKEKRILEEDFKEAKGFFSEAEGLEFFVNISQIIQTLSDSNFFEREIGSPILKGTLTKIEKLVSLTKFSKDADFSAKSIQIDKEHDLNFEISDKKREKIENGRITLALSFLLLTIQELSTGKDGKEKLISLLAEPKKLLRELVKIFFTTGNYIFDRKFLYSHVMLRFFYNDEFSEYRKETFTELFSLIKRNPPVAATSFSDYIELLTEKGMKPFFQANRTEAETTWAYFESSYYSGNIFVSRDRIFISNDSHYNGFVLETAATNLFLTLASLGLFEIIWDSPFCQPKEKEDAEKWENESKFYPFGKISYIKMTELGAYVFERTDKLEVKGLKNFAPPRLDEDSLIIHIDEGDKAMQIFLDSFCIPLSHTLYKADVLRLKKYCTNQNAVKTVFATLSARAEGKLPKIWQNLKKEILDSFVTLKAEEDWIVFTLENLNIKVISEIEKLSRLGLCSKMAGKRIAVKKSNIQAFKKKLESAGFKFN